jgi:hypothetical protein
MMYGLGAFVPGNVAPCGSWHVWQLIAMYVVFVVEAPVIRPTKP